VALESLIQLSFKYVGDATTEIDIRKYFRKGTQVVLKLRTGKWAVLRGITANSYLVNDPTPNNRDTVSPSEVLFGSVIYNPRCRGQYFGETIDEDYFNTY
jgi:hypothetical protein